jgi:hypothetical protein
MDPEEFEQIPWSGLVAHAQPAVDPKWYAVGGVVGAIIIVLLAMRMFAGSGPPDVAPILAVDESPERSIPTVASESPTVATEPVVTEADLMAIDEPVVIHDDVDVLRFVAEWFVTDYFTRDGSSETIASLEAALADVDTAAGLPHYEDDDAETFVEWAKAFAYEYPAENIADVSVAFRTVHRGDDGFIRDPVRAVVVGVSDWVTAPTVTDLPIFRDLP